MDIFLDSALAGSLLGIVVPIIVQWGKLLGLKAKQSLALLCCCIAFGVGMTQSVRANKIDIPSMLLAGFASLGVAVVIYEWVLKRLIQLAAERALPIELIEELHENDPTV